MRLIWCKGGDDINGIPKLQSLTGETASVHYGQYYGRVQKQLYYMLGDNCLAEDLTQEVFIKYLKAGSGIEHPGAWLSKVATHTAVSHIRKLRGKHDLNEITMDEIIEETADCFSIEDHVIRTETVMQVRRALKELTEQQRICLIMKFSGYSYDEIHRATSLPKGNIGQYIARGKERFMKLYGEISKGKDGDAHVL